MSESQDATSAAAPNNAAEALAMRMCRTAIFVALFHVLRKERQRLPESPVATRRQNVASGVVARELPVASAPADQAVARPNAIIGPARLTREILTGATASRSEESPHLLDRVNRPWMPRGKRGSAFSFVALDRTRGSRSLQTGKSPRQTLTTTHSGSDGNQSCHSSFASHQSLRSTFNSSFSFCSSRKRLRLVAFG